MTTLKEPKPNGEKELKTYDIGLLDREYRVRAKSRAKAVSQAIEMFQKDFPGSQLPKGLLRFTARTSEVKSKDLWNREVLEEYFSKERESDGG